MFKFKPDMYKKDIYEINYEKLQDLGIKYLFFDLDNTIITYKENMPNDKIMTLFFRLEEMGFKLFIFSNSYEKRLLPFKDKLNVEIYFSSMKPFKKNYKKVLNKYKKEECAFIGDQIMTDVIGAKRNGLFVIFVDKLDEYEPIRTKFCRFFEGFVLRNFNKNKILEKGFTLMCEKGYHNVNSVDIAKYAGVSTGIIYQYFTDKRDIFIEGVKNYSSNIMFPMIDILDNTKIDKNNLEKILNSMIDSFIDTHKMSKKAHEELIAMSHIDDEINQIFKDNELKMNEKIVNTLKYNNFNVKNLNEKVHIIIGLIDNFCHEIVYHAHKSLNYDEMKKEVINIVLYLLKD